MSVPLGLLAIFTAFDVVCYVREHGRPIIPSLKSGVRSSNTLMSQTVVIRTQDVVTQSEGNDQLVSGQVKVTLRSLLIGFTGVIQHIILQIMTFYQQAAAFSTASC